MEGLLLFLLIIAAVGYFLWKGNPFTRSSSKIIVNRSFLSNKISLAAGALGVFLLIFLGLGIKIVPVGHRLVVFNNLTKNLTSVGSGVNFVFPFVTVTTSYDIRRQEYTMSKIRGEGRKADWDDSLWSPTKEGLQIGIDLTCWYRIDPEKVTEVHRKIGPYFESKVIRPTIRSVVRLVISEYKVMDVYSEKRKNIQAEINKRIKDSLEKDGFIIDEVILRDVYFTPKFAKAIEEKQVAQQEAEKMNYLLEKERKEAERKVIEAEGRKKAIEIINEALKKNPDYIKYLYVEKLSDKISVIVSDQSTIMDLKGLIKK